MAERNQKVLDRVQEELEKDPSISSRQLYETAKGVDKSLDKLSLRQFNAGYVLPLKRKKGGGRRRATAAKVRKAGAKRSAAARPAAAGGRGGRSKAGGSEREQVREALMHFARDFARAEGKAQIVDVLGNLDPYIDRVLKAK
jgi:hypothetical protein